MALRARNPPGTRKRSSEFGVQYFSLSDLNPNLVSDLGVLPWNDLAGPLSC
jgi:hypothetical protein